MGIFEMLGLRRRAWGPSPHARPTATPAPATTPAPAADAAPAAKVAGEEPQWVRLDDEPSEEPALPPVQERIGDAVAALARDFSQDRRWEDAVPLLQRISLGAAQVRQPPQAAQRALAVLRRRSYGIGEVVALVEQDPSLSQALLRHANSACYAGLSTQPLTSLRSAVQRVGSAGVQAAIMHNVLHAQLSRPGSGLEPMVRLVWDHMVRTAPLARGLAPAFRGDPEEAFLLGLLHDVGKLVFFDAVAEERARLRRELVFPAAFVREALRVLHEPLGGLAAAEWGMGQRSAEVIATHHRRNETSGGDPLSQVVYAAEAVDVALQRGWGVDLAAIWEAGRLTADRAAAAGWLAAHLAAMKHDARKARRKEALGA